MIFKFKQNWWFWLLVLAIFIVVPGGLSISAYLTAKRLKNKETNDAEPEGINEIEKINEIEETQPEKKTETKNE